MVISYDDKAAEDDEYLENLAFFCYDEYGSSKLNYYKELFQRDSIDSVVSDDVSQPIEIPPPTISSDGLMNSSWPMFGHDTRHTCQSPYSTENNLGNEKWKFRAEIGIESSPAIDQNGVIYIGSYEHYLHAIYPNGTEKWRFDCGDWVSSSPAIDDDGTIYVGSWNSRLYAINSNGTLKWDFPSDGGLRSSPVVSEDGTVYFGVLGPGSSNGRIFALNQNGTEKWHYDTNFWIYTSPVLGEDGAVYVTSSDNNLYALYPNNGTLNWSFGFGDWPGSPAIANDGTIYVASYDDYLYAIYPNGTEKWRHSIDWGSGHMPSISNDGTIYIGQKYFYAINQNGTRKWTFELGDEYEFEVSTSSAISADGTIYFGATKGTIRGDIIAVNSNGTEKWRRIIANDWVWSSPAIGADGAVYIGAQCRDDNNIPFGYFYAFGELDPEAPEAPSIDGETNGETGVEYEYTFSTIDPNGDDVYYYIEWGDGEFEDWFGPFASGEEVVMSHTWDAENTYTIRARAKDTDNLWGPWGELEVTMPVNQQYGDSLFLRFLERFPNAFPVFRHF